MNEREARFQQEAVIHMAFLWLSDLVICKSRLFYYFFYFLFYSFHLIVDGQSLTPKIANFKL